MPNIGTRTAADLMGWDDPTIVPNIPPTFRGRTITDPITVPGAYADQHRPTDGRRGGRPGAPASPAPVLDPMVGHDGYSLGGMMSGRMRPRQ